MDHRRPVKACCGIRHWDVSSRCLSVVKWSVHGVFWRFPSRTLSRASHWLAFFSQFILVTFLLQVSKAHAPGHSYDVKEKIMHQTRHLSDAFSGGQGSTWALGLFCSFTASQISTPLSLSRLLFLHFELQSFFFCTRIRADGLAFTPRVHHWDLAVHDPVLHGLTRNTTQDHGSLHLPVSPVSTFKSWQLTCCLMNHFACVCVTRSFVQLSSPVIGINCGYGWCFRVRTMKSF